MELNPQQKKAAEYDKGHVLVLAGAGTGKTRTIIARAAHLIKNGVIPERILLLTFTRRAAKEMIRRLDEMIGEKSAHVMAGTFHHFCLYTMRRMPKHFGIENSAVIDRDDQVQLMRLIRNDYKKEKKDFPKASELINLSSYARNTNQPFQAYLERHTDFNQDTIEKVCTIFREFEKRKQLNNYLDYDDILSLFAEKLRQDPAVHERIQSAYDHILVDEMQDTNPLQWMILDGMKDPAKLFCVGDDAQSIYAFRGADFRNVHSFRDRVPQSEVLRLEENYRSTQGILDLSNWLLAESPISYEKKLTAHRKTRSTPKLINFDSDIEEAEWITRDLMERQRSGAKLRDHMIITRTGYGARAVESLMVEKNIPYRFVGGTSMLEAAHIKDLFSLVRASMSHLDELSWARYLKLWPGIGDARANRLVQEIKQYGSVPDALEHLSHALKNGSEIVAGVRIVLESLDSPPLAINKAGHFIKPLFEKQYENWVHRIKDFDLLERLAARFRSMSSFIETYILDPVSTSSAQWIDAEDIVTLTTVHSAKGTEATVCYLIRIEPGMYPHVRSLRSPDEQEEERRILYVAMTRAQDELILTRTYNVHSFGMAQRSYGGYYGNSTDYFFEDLDERLVEQIDMGF